MDVADSARMDLAPMDVAGRVDSADQNRTDGAGSGRTDAEEPNPTRVAGPERIQIRAHRAVARLSDHAHYRSIEVAVAAEPLRCGRCDPRPSSSTARSRASSSYHRVRRSDFC